MDNNETMSSSRFTNRLAEETSPYLLQHAHNPVSWHPWDEAALNKARNENKPILLSIGYSACHWCHVMEHESFEDENVADFLNQHFICIKVDREERPDLDKIYQTAHHLLTQRAGGWPLNVVITPDEHAPFFAGTYFPNEPRHGLPSFLQVMQHVHAHYQQHRDDMSQHASAVKDALLRMEPGPSQSLLTHDIVEQAIDELIAHYDPVNGGFGDAPKFPHPSNLALCLAYRGAPEAKQAQRALHIAQHSLQAMADGGLYDHLGGGFYRYSVDKKWMIPHFEKMLYDNAQLLPLYADLSLIRQDDDGRVYKQLVEQTGNWVMHEMQSNAGGYYSTLDADSEGEEGKFYVWTVEELKSLLTEEQWPIFEVRFGLLAKPNFEGKWHLNVAASLAATAQRCGITEEKVETLLEDARQTLFAVRERRVRPTRDDKILTSWNGMLISAMAHCGRLMELPRFTDSAERALRFAQQELWKDGCLFAATKDGKTRLNGYLDDYVFLLDGVLALLQCRWDERDLTFAIDLANRVLSHFEDPQQGGLFFTSSDHETLLHRTKPAADDSIPSGNGIGALGLLRLGHILAEQRYLLAAERILKSMGGSIARFPSAHCALLLAMQEYLRPIQTIVLRGSEPELNKWQAATKQRYNPRRLVFAIPDDVTELPGILAERRNQAEATAYVCQGFSCQAPITDLSEFENLILNT